MKNRKPLAVLITMLLFCGSCKKHHYNACFTSDKTSATINEIISFSNCSDYDGGFTEAVWNFGDGATANTNAGAGVQHTYSAAGTYQITLTVGEKENNSEKTISISIQ